MGLKVPDPPIRYNSPPKISIKLSSQKMYNFKLIQPPKNQGGVIH